MENKNNISINYIELIKKSFQMTWQNRYLWWLGFFMIFSSGGINLFKFSSPEKNNTQDTERIWNFISSNLSWIIPSVIFLILFLILLSILGIFARAGIIRSAEKIEKKERFGFKIAMKEGKKYFWKFFFLNILLSIAMALIATVMIAPIALLFSVKAYIIGGILIFIAILIFIPLAIIFAFIKIFGQIYLVLGNLKLKDSIENAYHLFLKNIKNSLIMAILFIPLCLALGFISLAVFVILAIVFGLLGLLLYFAFKMIGIFLAIGLGVLAFIIFILTISSFYQAFAQIIWVLFFKEIASPKAEEIIAEIAQEEALTQKTPEPAGGISPSKID